ncbi:MAG TPA: YeeE/YedE thiosulfate transporter family protein [Myxococcota bacterium]|nr:YeeE/YedE thiosulfate transporter family protein [Myxococcota bacterium]HRY91995.1 YeeE/YedE thiosulfate transporter family protein [Myxococcota bacterium]HSA23277.1 YeeE/YedE thiosulfate transporter family protein [Myxococcota bacterium]
MFPLDLDASVGHLGANALYVLAGFLFGFALEQAGFGNSKNLAAQFYLRDMRVLKVMFTAIVTAMLLLVGGDALGLVRSEVLFVNPTHLWPGIVGGLVFGVGFVVGGYCPGTALVSLATLKADGLFFVLGLFVGVTAFGESVGLFQAFFDASGNYGELTLPALLGVSPGLVAFGVVAMALAMFFVAERVEAHFAARDGGKPC